MNFQVTVLKILVSHPDGFAAMEDIKRDMAILATSGRDWTDRTKRLAARMPGLDIFSQGLIERLDGGWRVTAKGRAALDLMEGRAGNPQTAAGGVQSAAIRRCAVSRAKSQDSMHGILSDAAVSLPEDEGILVARRR